MGLTDIPQITKVYKRLSDNLAKQGDYILSTGELANNQLSPWFKYHADETQAYRDAKALVDQSKKRYDEKIKELTTKKLQLFKKGDVRLWKCNEEEQDEAKSYKTDFEMAKRFILP